jgi:hypothetical protein
MAGHAFENFLATDNEFVHYGNTGGASEGHTYDGLEDEHNKGVMYGDYADDEAKQKAIRTSGSSSASTSG